MKGFLKTMNIAEFKNLINKLNYSKWEKEDLIELVEDVPELLDESKTILEQRRYDLYWKAEGLFDRANSLENEASTINTLIEIMYGE